MLIVIILSLSTLLYSQQEFINDPYCGSDDVINIKSIKYPSPNDMAMKIRKNKLIAVFKA